MVQDWPSLNALVWLRLPCCGAEHPTRVEDFDETSCVVAAPISPHTKPVDPNDVNGGFFLGWAHHNGALEVPVSLTETDDDPVPTWTLTAEGPGVQTQRRNYVRLSIDLTVELFMLEGGAPTRAKLVDLSEGGFRCYVDQWAIDPGTRIFSTRIALEERDFYLRSQMAWWGNSDAAKGRQLGIRFIDIEPKEADAIRAYIFAAQLAERRSKLT